ncbi:hypothetical protein [Acinetobacter pittii]|uniref:hypothetical protein n=1 Tax=Acinetobacter pittii TaxID=48296 RepID=UPI00197F2418|nr:hypothetical protein [Acinetobacter pittii]MBN6514149.1 hypothetical protein [Acinetobacter pittii]MBN6540604.1 hypothetical protein [Acinetobacter pittii]MCE6236339.1 hypothetical protein [Acinetobacter pittii]MCE6691850.1 hypothetical protein [Acinetobacter pittii]MCE6698883.1 hypothetical protein [Acinetobacter pittii]
MIIYDGQVADNYMYQDSNQAAIVVSHSAPSLPYPFTMKPNNHQTQTSTNPPIDVEKFVEKLESVTSRRSKARCARSIRLALESAGANVENHPIAASDWGDTLKKIGYKQIDPAFDEPQEGDIYIIHRTRNHVYGHIAGYTGSEWVSDFKQNSYDVYKDDSVTYTYYRLAA